MTDLTSSTSTSSEASEDVAGIASRLGRRRFLQTAGAVAGAGAVSSLLPAGVGEAATSLPAGSSVFKPLPNAVRAVDTRPDYNRNGKYTFTNVNSGRRRHVRLQVAGRFGVPDNAVAVVASVTGINLHEPNWVAVFPSGGSVPEVSTLNLAAPADVTANLAQFKIGTNGQVDIYSRTPCDVIFDVVGYYEPVSEPQREGRFLPLTSARRAIDTRNTGGKPASRSTHVVDLTAYSVPADASAAVINLTATESDGPGYFTVYADGQKQPPTSSLNYTQAGATRAVAAIVPVENIGGRRKIKMYVHTSAHFIVDVTGYFTSESSGLSTNGYFVPVAPRRILDTRDVGQIGRMWPRWVVEGTVPGAAATGAAAIVTNLTGADSRGPGYLTMSAARQPIPGTSNLNFFTPNAFVPNHVICPITRNHGFQVYSSHGTHVIVDMTGYYTGTPQAPRVPKYVNPAPPPAPPAWIIQIPRFGLTSTILSGNAVAVTDSGYSWHWTGTGYLGQSAHVSIFGHRTEAGGPYRNIHWMQNGDLFTVSSGDRREYTYRVVRRDLTDANNANILAATRRHPGTTFSIVACTVGYDSSKSLYPDKWAPTSLLYRIIVTGELVSWREF